MKIVVRIERLVLDGVGTEPGDARRIRGAVERELARLFGSARTASVFSAGTAVAEVPAPQIQLAARESPERTGYQIAGAVHAGIARDATNGAPPPAAAVRP